jgi:predicted HNH restriction endonuclease
VTLAEELDARWQRNFEAAQKRIEVKNRAIDYLGGKCRICGYDKCPSAMVFHHLDPREKDFDISSRLSWEAIEPELKKCVLLCSNCHHEVHAGWYPEYLSEEELGVREVGSVYDLESWDLGHQNDPRE